MLKTVLLSLLGLFLLAVLAVLAIASTRPDTFRVARTQRIAAPAERIFPLVEDLRAFNRWNPYVTRDPQLQGRYSGPERGPGAAYAFASDKSGTGSFTVTGIGAPREVVMRLDMQKPFAAQNVVTFTLVLQGAATDVTWAMQGAQPFMGRVMGVFFDMDRMIGGDFATGLSQLRALAEKP